MEALDVQRVLVEFSRVVTDLEELEAHERAKLDRLRVPLEGLTAAEREDIRGREQRQLGVLEGLVQAELAVFARRQAFARAHRPGSAEWIRTRPTRPDAADGGVSPSAGHAGQGGLGHPTDGTPGV